MNLARTLALLVFLLPASVALAEDAAQSVRLDPEQARQKLLAARPELPIRSVVNGPVPGFYEISLEGGMTLYMNDTADFLFAGDLYLVAPGSLVNATEGARTETRKELLDGLDESEMVVFAPPQDQVKATITVFTDIDCGYCRKLHSEVPQLNDLGIAVRYLAYPRAGIGSPSYDKLVSAWCADDPRAALTQAKLGKDIEPRVCENPVARQKMLGEDFGVTGTPAIVYESGQLQAGYAPAAEMAKRLGIN